MNAVVADTNAIVWALFDPSRLSGDAFRALDTAARTGQVFVSAISLVELIYLYDRKKTFQYAGVLARLKALVDDPAEPFVLSPVTLDVALAVERVPKAEVPDMPDRVIAATAIAHGLPLITADAKLRNSTALKSLVPVIW